MIQKILLATDGSPASDEAEAYALYLARIGRGVLTVVYVRDNRLCHYGEVDQLVTETTKQQFVSYVQTENIAEGDRILRSFAEKARKEGVPYTTSIREGDPATEIVAEAGEKESDLLIMGGGGRSGRFFKRSSGVAQQVLKNSPCPVLVTDRK